jgi:hypothetical protein
MAIEPALGGFNSFIISGVARRPRLEEQAEVFCLPAIVIETFQICPVLRRMRDIKPARSAMGCGGSTPPLNRSVRPDAISERVGKKDRGGSLGCRSPRRAAPAAFALHVDLRGAPKAPWSN